MRRGWLLVVVALLAGCGSSAKDSKTVSLALDFTPNAVHAPLFMAVQDGLDKQHGVHLQIRQPGSGPDSLKLVESGRVQMGVLDIQDLAIAQQQGADVVAVAALVEKPLGALAARPGIDRPRELAGRTVGVSGLPSDPAFLKAIVEADGGDYAKVKQVTIGFSAVARMLSGRVDAAPVFWNAEGVALRRAGLAAKEFRIDQYGAPSYPEVVLITSKQTLAADRPEIERAVGAISDGIAAVRKDPAAAVKVIAKAAQADDTGLVRAQLDAVKPLFGTRLDMAVLRKWAAFDARIGIVKRAPDVGAAFTPVSAR